MYKNDANLYMCVYDQHIYTQTEKENIKYLQSLDVVII